MSEVSQSSPDICDNEAGAQQTKEIQNFLPNASNAAPFSPNPPQKTFPFQKPMMTPEAESLFFKLSDDVVLNIFFKLQDDPRNWARLTCVCTKFSSLVNAVCYKSKCLTSIPSISADLLPSSTSSAAHAPPGGWSALHKIAVCCPGLHHAGVLLENSDFGLDRELGPHDNYQPFKQSLTQITQNPSSSSSNQTQVLTNSTSIPSKRKGKGDQSKNEEVSHTNSNSNEGPDCSWSLYDDLYFDTVYQNKSENEAYPESNPAAGAATTSCGRGIGDDNGGGFSTRKRRRRGPVAKRSHLATGVWNLSREEGNKLLASRFREDCLYICDWPGCVHIEEKRNYMLFRGIFRNFKRSGVWRTINDGGNGRSKIDLNCAFCGCKETWDMQSAFCLRRVFGYHDDGQPVVRAFVCENGHVSGAWTDWPLYT
ncbi:hypothetical protein Ancab_010384 [Ancistrocladus abbreviatus]